MKDMFENRDCVGIFYYKNTVYLGFFRGNLIFAISPSPKIKHVEIMFAIVCHKKSFYIILNCK
jgi:hypothetical protein